MNLTNDEWRLMAQLVKILSKQTSSSVLEVLQLWAEPWGLDYLQLLDLSDKIEKALTDR